MPALNTRIAVGPVDQADLPELGAWSPCSALSGMDLSLDDRARTRVSALPWRGQFSPETVERILAAFAPINGTVLDPFVGSGTTLLEAARRGSAAIGLDVNPAAIALASCVALASLPPADRDVRLGHALVEWSPDEGPGPLGSDLTTINEAHAFALLAHIEGSMDKARARFRTLAEALPAEPVPVSAELGDARSTSLDDGSIAFILTSPPYINVFNYHQYGRPLSDEFGWPVLAAARSEIGSNRQNRGNRFRTVVQYAIDMALSICEMTRVLKADGTAVIVVGRESRVRGVSVYNGELLARLVRALDAFNVYERAERSFVSRFGERIFEDILILSGPGAADVSPDRVEATGREVGREALEACVAGPDTRSEVEIAIADSPAIGRSPEISRANGQTA